MIIKSTEKRISGVRVKGIQIKETTRRTKEIQKIKRVTIVMVKMPMPKNRC